MDRPPLWPIVKLRLGPKIQFSANTSRRIGKTISVCIELEIEKNDTVSQLTELIISPQTPPHTPRQLTGQPQVKIRRTSTKYRQPIQNDTKVY